MPCEIKENIILAPYTIYKIGGSARFFAEVKNAEELKGAFAFAQEKNIPFFIMGAGSNMLVSDKGFDGLAIRMAGGDVRSEGDSLIADAGVMMARVVLESAKAGLSGFEWAIGVPGTIGGSVRGNAGCFGGEMKDVVEKVGVFDSLNPKPFTLNAHECQFAYRDSVFKKHPEWVILSATLKLHRGDPAAIRAKIAEITAERTKKQDIGTQSCGCIFKNIPWEKNDMRREELFAKIPEAAQFAGGRTIPASFLIDRAGLKGRRVGKIIISPKHTNFFVNEGGASADEVRELIKIAKDAVAKKFCISLEEEIQYVGF